MTRTRLARRRAFQCLHKYMVPSWSEAANSRVFGACFTPHGHGHNYELEVYIEGIPDPLTGMIINLADVDVVLEQVIKPIDGKHLNFEVPEFSSTVPTTEHLAKYLWQQLEPRFTSEARLIKIRLYEYENLWVDIWAN